MSLKRLPYSFTLQLHLGNSLSVSLKWLPKERNKRAYKFTLTWEYRTQLKGSTIQLQVIIVGRRLGTKMPQLNGYVFIKTICVPPFH